MTLSTNLDVNVIVEPVVAGIERGRLKNNWLDCPFAIHPASPGSRGVGWEAEFVATDDPSLTFHFIGVAETRRHAKQIIIQRLTQKMAQVVHLRALRQGLAVVAPGGITVPAPGLLGWLLRAFAKVRAFFRRAP